MRKFKKLSLTLALLITAVGGAWAQDYYINVNFNSSYNCMETHFHCTIMSMGPEATVKGTLNLSVDGVSKGSFNVDGEMFDGDIAPVDAGNHTWSAVFSPNGGGSFNGNGNFTIDKLSTSIIYDDPTSINMGEGESTELVVYVAPDGTEGLSYSSSDASVASIAKKEYSNDTYIIQAKATGTATITFSFAENTNYKAAEEDVTITVTVLPAPIKVTTNAAEEGATFTEASFNMPAFDATADYELVRDMSIQMTATMGDGTDGYRIRIKKDGESFVPAEMTLQEMMGLYKVHDGIENQDLVFYGDGKVCDISIFAVDDQDQPTGDAIAFTALTPGRYVAIATAAQGTIYDGQTPASNIFVLYQGYEVEVAAKEFITYYKDEPLYVEDEDAVLYTISSVNGDQAVLSEKSDAMPSNTPMLVYNKSNETKVILLIPCAEPDMDITVAPEFQGTLTATTIAASTDAQTNYAFNGKQFVWVKDAVEIGANKAWLSINTGVPSARITLVFEDETTKIANTNITNITNGDWYDLNGRKLQGIPTKKGVYLMNGKKVVVK